MCNVNAYSVSVSYFPLVVIQSKHKQCALSMWPSLINNQSQLKRVHFTRLLTLFSPVQYYTLIYKTFLGDLHRKYTKQIIWVVFSPAVGSQEERFLLV